MGEWKSTTLGDVITLQRGFDLPSQKRKQGKVPIVSSSGISDYHSEVGVKGPGVVTGRYGTIGQVFLIKQDYWPLNTTLWVKDFHGNNPQFASYLLRTIDFLSCSDKSSVPGVNRNDLHRIPVLLPPLPEQKRIAHILGTLDDKIELNRRMNATLEAMARALFKSWFVDFDPVRAKLDGRKPEGIDPETAALFPSEFQDSSLGQIPKGWSIVRVDETCENIFSGGTPSTQNANYWGGEIPWLSSGETRSPFIIETEKTITEAGVKNSSTRLAQPGCTVIAGAGQGHTRGQTSLLLFESYINQSVVVLASNPNVSSNLFLFFDLARRYEEFRQLSDSHSSRGSLTTKLLAGVKMVLPSRLIIEKFDHAVTPLVDQITANLRQSRTLTALRDTLLPKLLSGELRLEASTN